MPYNKLQVPDLGIEKSRLTILLDELSIAFETGAFSTREELLQQWSTIIGEFQDTIGNSVFDPQNVKPDTSPDTDLHNNDMRDIAHDMAILFLRLKLLGQLIVSTFNQTSIERDDLLGRVRQVAAKLTDLRLYEGALGEIVSESFINTNLLDIDSSKLSLGQASVVLDEGIVCLGEQSVDNVAIESIVLDRTSFNGMLGK